MRSYDGRKDKFRRDFLEGNGGTWGMARYDQYRKKTTIFARSIPEDFEVETIEGLHTGKAGDYLAVGIAGEMYPIDAKVFEESYEKING